MSTIGNQGSLLNTITFSEFTDLVRRNWVWVQNFLPRNARQLFLFDTIGSGQGSSKRYNEVDTETFADYKAEGVNSSKAKVGVGYQKDMEARTFSKEVEVTLEMRNDNRYLEVGSLITSLTHFLPEKQELDLTHRFTFATSTSYTDQNGETVDVSMGDDLSLSNASHTLAFSSTTYRNRVSGDPAFSQGSYEAALLLMASQTYNNFGERRQTQPNVIVTWSDPGTIREVKQLIQSGADIDAVQSGIVNVYANTVRHVELPHLATTATGAYDSTKRRWWFVIAANQGMNGWQAYLGEWISPQLLTPSDSNAGMDIHNYNWTYSTYGRYGIVVLSGRSLAGSHPTS